MSVTLSVATSADGYIDDLTPNRLVLSTPEDWEEVYALRAQADAILIGAETLRRDNPTLRLKRTELMEWRESAGLSAEPARVIVSGRGEISPDLRIFSEGEGRIIIFSNISRPELTKAEVIVAQDINAAYIVTELEKMGIVELFVEGGAKILDMFTSQGIVDKLRLARNRKIIVGEPSAPHFTLPDWIAEAPGFCENLGGMDVQTYEVSDTDELRDEEFMDLAISVSRQSPPSPSCYRVGAVIVTESGEVFDGYTLETSPTHHAEQAAMTKAKEAGADLRGATIYASMEPCSQRKSEPLSCSQLIMNHGFNRVVFALYEPSHFVNCQGAYNLRKAGIEVKYMPHYAKKVRKINAHVLEG
ncbi:MAG: dihydrofolate reductase family protein [Rikenellaceae bacterium]